MTLMLRIALHSLEGEAVEGARQLMMAQTPTPTEERIDFTIVEMPTCGLIKSNAFPLTPPSEIYEFDLKQWPKEKDVGVFRREHLRKGHCCGSLQESLRFRNDR